MGQNTCAKSGKVKRTKHNANDVARKNPEVHHVYKCNFCGTYHLSSGGNTR